MNLKYTKKSNKGKKKDKNLTSLLAYLKGLYSCCTFIYNLGFKLTFFVSFIGY